MIIKILKCRPQFYYDAELSTAVISFVIQALVLFTCNTRGRLVEQKSSCLAPALGMTKFIMENVNSC
jgi:hypothetical protein